MVQYLQNVSDMNARSAIRIARTAITGAENRARVDSYVAANEIGINCEKQWMASLDGRTRDSHRALDGHHVKPDAVFDNGCRFPGDPQAPAGEAYNCRCTLVAYIPGHNTMKGRSDATVGSLSYEEWKAGVKEQQPESASGRSLEKFLELPSVQKRIKASGMSKKKLTDAMREDMRSQGYQDLRAFKTLPKSRQQGILSDCIRKPTPRKDTTIEKALLKQKVQKKDAKAISKLVTQCKDKDAVRIFEQHIGQLKINDVKDDRAFFRPIDKTLNLNMRNTAAGFAARRDKAPYQTFFHEFGHYIDFNMTGGKTYQSQVMELGATAKKEVRNTLNRIKKENGYKNIQQAKIHLTYDVAETWVNNPAAMGGISDIINGATNGSCCENKYGFPIHRKSYWKHHGETKLSTETFAHFYETTMSNPEALDTLKRYLPESYNVFKQIIKGV